MAAQADQSTVSFSREQISQLTNTLGFLEAQKITALYRFIAKRQQQSLPCDKKISELTALVEKAESKLQARITALPSISFDDNLPISAKRDSIAELIEANQVLVLAGETGSGKTTQIPKICLQLKRGLRGMIGHTQPRRIAARTVASRIADELNVKLGTTVGYQVRFNDHSNENTLVKLMTDGILLAEIQQDPLLLKYDTLIIDEAHERSLNIDFLLGYLRGLLQKRPELKLIVTSATIDLEKFSKHFNNAPIIEVSGRTYPVETIYRPWDIEHDDVTEGIVGCVDEIVKSSRSRAGDILIFLSGEREIRETSHALKKAGFNHLDVLPLYARLSLAEQNRVFQSHAGRRVVLATNVAETSLTVPGIRYVIDPGRARISRYSVRTKVQRLPIEAISQASANQRKGRCGRVAEGICYRLYDEDDFNSRPEFTDPEIQRTNLAAVILQMLQLKIGDIRKFPFVDKPENRLISDGFKLLEELQAVDKKGVITKLGRQLHSLPVDPRLSRIIVEAKKYACVKEALIIVSGLSIQDPRERPADKRQAADEKHRRFWDEESDFIAYIKLWDYLEEQRQELTRSQFQKMCKKEFINYLRVREWRDLHHQLRLALKTLGLKENSEPSNYESIHRALLAGMLSNLGFKNEDKKNSQKGEKEKKRPSIEYLGSRNRKFQIFPGSSQFKKKPQWLMAAEFLETSQLFAHMVAKVNPDWALESGRHLLKHHYYEAHYDAHSGQVMAYDRITLFGLTLVEKKRVPYGKVNREEARSVFIREALVEGKYEKHKSVRKNLESAQVHWSKIAQESDKNETNAKHFYSYNRWLVSDIESLEAKARRKDILVDDQVIYDFYQETLPADITNLAGFEHWRKTAEQEKPNVLMLDRASLMLHQADGVTGVQFPDTLEVDGLTLALHYHFEPGHADDGVSIRVPVEFLHMLPQGRLEWMVPGLLRDKCIALVKGLPKQIRKQIVPVPQYVDRALSRVQAGKRALHEVLAEVLKLIADVNIESEDWPLENLDDYYRMNIQVVDENGKIIDRDRNLEKLRSRYRQQVKRSVQAAHHSMEKQAITQWDFGALQNSVQLPKHGIQVKGFPALLDKKESVSLSVLDNPLEARYETEKGIVRLATLQLAQTIKYLKRDLLKGKDLGLTVVNMGSRAQVIDDIIHAAIAQACFPEGTQSIREQDTFKACVESGRSQVVEIAQQYEAALAEILVLCVEIKKAMKSNKNALALAFAFGDINKQLEELFSEGFLWQCPFNWLKQYPRYLQAILKRIEKAPQNPQRDRVLIAGLQGHWQKHEDSLKRFGPTRYWELEAWQEYRWMIEELRVSLFAQTLKTLFPVSDKRLNKQWQQVLDALA
ncbi:ATP-dependent helicase HrpA [Alteromonadaceae bacterium Bs31]|nr:ATP-dependent helicase HrpA [Alteromonadaceae bacterium Bs31]